MVQTTRNGRPPTLLFFGSFALLLVTAVLFPLGGGSSGVVINWAGFVLGSVLGVGLLGLFMVRDNAQRATRRYSDWGAFSPRRVIPYMALLTWLMGVIHIFFAAKELTR